MTQQRHMEAINSFVGPAHTPPLRPSSVLLSDGRRGIEAVQLPGKGTTIPTTLRSKPASSLLHRCLHLSA